MPPRLGCTEAQIWGILQKKSTSDHKEVSNNHSVIIPTPTFSSQPHYCQVSLTQCFHSALVKQASTKSQKEPEKKAAAKHLATEQKTSHRSQAHLLAGAVKRRRYSLVLLKLILVRMSAGSLWTTSTYLITAQTHPSCLYSEVKTWHQPRVYVIINMTCLVLHVLFPSSSLSSESGKKQILEVTAEETTATVGTSGEECNGRLQHTEPRGQSPGKMDSLKIQFFSNLLHNNLDYLHKVI